jgi:tyrosyl-tRNA synthetase
MDKIDEALTRGVENVYPSRKAFEKRLRSDKKIKLYQGFDPSMENLHLGNLVGLLKLKQFQDLGHEIVFLVGDFTGMIGDPTDRASSRKLLTRKQVLANSKTWREQAGKIINFSGKNPARLMFNSQWGDKVTFKDLIEITSKFTVQQMLERDFFQRRLKAKRPIHLHEFLYPVAQAIDCVEMDVDLEIGGSDQTFNMLAGRVLMKALKGKEKFVLTTKLLVDAKGEKVGKTAGNALFFNASASDMYGGVMSFPDETILPGFELLTQVPMESIKTMEKELKKKPMELKKKLAWEIVKMLYSEKDAKNAEKEFERVFQKRVLPSDIPILEVKNKEISLPKFLVKERLVSSASVAKRLINQGGVDINGKTVKDYQKPIKVKDEMVIRCGKRKFIKIRRSN